MKALILAAGFGTRLLPHTEKIPKPLFTIQGRALLDITIHKLLDAGCSEIAVNTHHLHTKIETFLNSRNYPIPVVISHEQEILGTGGAIKKLASFWNENPFIVINSDIVTDIDLKKPYTFHLNHNFPVTLVMHDYPEFNNVSVSKNNFITGFHNDENEASADIQKLAFTGIQVIDPIILDFIPGHIFYNSIDLYKKLISRGIKVAACISENHYWNDIGTVRRYQEAGFDKMAPESFRKAFPDNADGYGKKINKVKIKGDGSDRNWYRLTSGHRSLIMADHGIRSQDSTTEVDSFVSIGQYLHKKGMPVPEIYLYDTFSGLVFMDDLGRADLQSVITETDHTDKIISHYKSVLNLLINFSVSCGEDFDGSWTYQTRRYDKNLIIEKECRYFVDAFLNGFTGMEVDYENFADEFSIIADNALSSATYGFMHRDMQSRNIMVLNNNYYFIDFQGGRIGPIQYDIASLLIDPYVELPLPVQDQLLHYSFEVLSSKVHMESADFFSSYRYCAMARNLQILGAFGYLSRIKGKTYFENYIPAALKSLKHILNLAGKAKFPKLTSLIDKL